MKWRRQKVHVLDNKKRGTQGTTNYSHKTGFRSVTKRLSWKQRGVNVMYTETNNRQDTHITKCSGFNASWAIDKFNCFLGYRVILNFILKKSIALKMSTVLLQTMLFYRNSPNCFAVDTNAVKSAQLVINSETFIDKSWFGNVGNFMHSLWAGLFSLLV